MKYPLVYNDKCFLNSKDVIDYVADKIDRDFANIIEKFIDDEVWNFKEELEDEYGNTINILEGAICNYRVEIVRLLDITQTLMNYAKCEECLSVKAIQDLNNSFDKSKQYFVDEGVYYENN